MIKNEAKLGVGGDNLDVNSNSGVLIYTGWDVSKIT
jgi:hypothetical protein